ncbi:two component transcriptional regulator, LytTR family [Saccharicrinis carchari]|uniref:Two component transcriptional regulator, LytTR family n=1 Tax=Saccharicrinis carchari TaxID=1168039 RepID=A0A521BAK4_SACCC|nr:LytTR family DNA-binding domain-containing protein [Saccharicrinis carchari]SMO44103.1 two component transcriptional regulator, LytTR family [Saccharicrinis carchari]
MLTAAIIDDEYSARQSLELILRMYLNETIEVVTTADNLKDGVLLIKKHAPDIVFLDISMPQQSGLDFFSYFNTINFDVVFVTAHQHYAINAVGLGASGYILKPIKPKQIIDEVNKINLKKEKYAQQLAKDSNAGYNNCKLLVNHQKGLHIVAFNEITVVLADGNSCKIIKTNGECLSVNKTIGSIQESLPQSHFFRTHRSCIVNLNFITEIDKEKNKIILSDTETPVASSNIKLLIARLSRLSHNCV